MTISFHNSLPFHLYAEYYLLCLYLIGPFFHLLNSCFIQYSGGVGPAMLLPHIERKTHNSLFFVRSPDPQFNLPSILSFEFPPSPLPKQISLLYYYQFLQFHELDPLVSDGALGFPSLGTDPGIYFIENEAALSNTGSNPLPRLVKLYSTLTGYSDTILLLTIPSRSSSRKRSVRTLGDMPSIFSMKRLNCVLPLRISLMTRTVHLFPIILKVVSIGHDLSSGMLYTVSIIEQLLSVIYIPLSIYRN